MKGENASSDNEMYRFGPFRLDAEERRLARDGKTISLTPKAFELLLILIREANHVKSREELMQALWPATIVEEHNLTVTINLLRKLLGEDDGRPYIETVRGYGYRFVAPVEAEPPDEPKELGNEPADVGAASAAISSSAHPIAAKAAPTRRRTTLLALAGASIIVIAGVLIWRFAPLGSGGEDTAASAPSIAVLPFENLSADKSNAYFVRGIQDLIITKLAGIGSLKVISRTSTERYPSHPGNLRKIARELGVTTILEGSVQKEGDRVLINLQLIDAKSGSHLWARAYTRKLDNVFDVESKVAQDVAATLKLRLFPREAKRLTHGPTNNPQAYDLFLRADYLAAQVETRKTEDPARAAARAEDLYRQALAQDPDFALAQARLSILDSYVYWYDLDHAPARIAEARKTAAAAIAAGLPQGHLAMGYVYYRGYRNYSKALEEFKQTRRLLPNSVEAIGAIAFVQRRRGDWQAALAKLHRAELLDPRNPLWRQARGETLVQLRRYTEAMVEFDHAFSLAPQYYLALIYKASAQFLSGRAAEAKQSLNEIPEDANLQGMLSVARFNSALLARQLDRALAALAPVTSTTVAALFMVGDVPVSLLRARAWALKGNKTEARENFAKARETLTQMLKRRPDDPNVLSFLGLAEAGLGNSTAAIRDAKRAAKLLPVTKDAFYGPSHLTALAIIYAQTGNTAAAVKQLTRLLAIPAGLCISPALLRLDPVWDPIRHDPTFQALLKQYAPKGSRINPMAPSASRAAPASAPQ